MSIAYKSVLASSTSSGGTGIIIDVICSEICAGHTISCSDGSTTLTASHSDYISSSVTISVVDLTPSVWSNDISKWEICKYRF